ncbi:hypothetical protein D3C86_1070880 [compost metagenome]
MVWPMRITMSGAIASAGAAAPATITIIASNPASSFPLTQARTTAELLYVYFFWISVVPL